MPIGIVGIRLDTVEVTSQTLSGALARRCEGQTTLRRPFASGRTLLLASALGSLVWLVVAPSTAALILLVSSVIGTFGWKGAPNGALADVIDV